MPVLLLILGLLAGVMSGLFGIGGGIVIVPALTILLGFVLTQAVATSLAALLLPVGIFAVITYRRANLIDLRASMLIAAGLFVTSLVGAELALALPDTLFKQFYGVFCIVMGVRFAEILGKPKREARPDTRAGWLPLLGIGLVAGVMSGMFGIGGGIIIVPALTILFGYEQKTATGSSLGALLLPVGLPGVLRYAAAGQFDLLTALPVAIGLAIGALGGARLAIALPSGVIRRAYGGFLIVVGVWFLVGPLLGF
jgi:uncharacterized membrane protein YfcA